TPGPRGSARTPPEGAPPAALSSVADAPHRRPPPPCSRTHQAPLTGNRQGAADPVGVIRRARPLAPVVTVPSVPLQCRDEHDAPTRLVPRPARPAPGTLVGRHRLDRAPARPGGRGGTGSTGGPGGTGGSGAGSGRSGRSGRPRRDGHSRRDGRDGPRPGDRRRHG